LNVLGQQLVGEVACFMPRTIDPDVALHRAGAAVVEALRWLGEAADALDADRCRELVHLGQFGREGAVSGFFAGPPRVLAFRLPGVLPRYRIFRSPEAATHYRVLRMSAQVALRRALERGFCSGAVPRGLKPFGPGSLLFVEYTVSPEGGPLDADNVWVKVISDSLQALGYVPDDRCLNLYVGRRSPAAGEAGAVVALVDPPGDGDPLAPVRRWVGLALSADKSSHNGSR